ncbi:hypothetical protein KQX54_012325 [Cotesia glomerata]|uniref:Uncharacterized protein n=1 Tax=Cotesia glomerata TaxID=32391 RepID=A0AAV7IUR1_COTGL|nr:hypothetical protein KQX54_012325 [Cotesia glomerata]
MATMSVRIVSIHLFMCNAGWVGTSKNSNKSSLGRKDMRLCSGKVCVFFVVTSDVESNDEKKEKKRKREKREKMSTQEGRSFVSLFELFLRGRLASTIWANGITDKEKMYTRHFKQQGSFERVKE